jgi:RluA family pseudouridine synthase
MFEVHHMADEEHDGMRLDQFIQTYLESFSRETVKKKIKDKEILIKGRPGTNKPSSILHHKDEIIIYFYKTAFEDEYWRKVKINLELSPEIIYEDDNLLVVSKPPFMSTHPAGRHVFNCATVFFEMKYNQTIHSLHRIDRETSGILMLGKNSAMAQTMMKHFEEDNVKKCYLFIAQKTSAYKGEKTFEAKERMASPEDGLKRVYVETYPENSKDGKHAHTKFVILEEFNNYVVCLAFPQTGRQHQIRVHAKAHGLPLLGDKLYLGNYEMFQRFKDGFATEEDHDLMQLPRHALHAIALKIPYMKSERIFRSHIPTDFKAWLIKNSALDIAALERKIASFDL